MTTPGVEDVENEAGKMKLKSGQFTNVDKRGLDATGQGHYNVEIHYVYHDIRSHGVVSEGGKRITMMNGSIFEFMDEEAQKKMKDDQDPADNPPNSYNPQPDKMGKILWITGISGMGKTTTAKLLQEKEGFVNYEGDCFLMGLNPYVGSAPKGSSYFGTRPLSGIPQERKDICKLAMEKGYMEVLKGNPVDPKIWEDFYNLLCEDILKERSKLGGMWVVGQAVYTKAAREVIRRRLGDDLTMIVLESGEENLQLERLSKRALGSGEVSKEAREGSEKALAKYTGRQESVEDDEENTFALKVTKAMTPEDVAKMALSHV
eukprot:TRINITY_DN4873_c0_g1_i1.p1 TRINITY_DN4873_c0_g1~~TRINITY_DN4873_c0_g1_i1.p1  ORF type:complete len:318 (-),score=83.98 TRINITY_DN4873_c0_g1_i1:72-1025(-)